jgi:3-oxoacyl-[acyl-carrier-protein] synthase-3
MPYAHITGWGMAIPEKVLTNNDLSKVVDTNDAWIQERTGIRERRVAREGQYPSTLGAEASMKALEMAGLSPRQIDLIICATSSPEHIFPATACLIQDAIGAENAGAFDLLAACTGFIYAVNMASQAIRSGAIKSALVIGTETLSRFVNWKDRNTCILFGDGAGAFVLQASEEPGGVHSTVMHSDGSGGDLLTVPAGGARHPASDFTVHTGMHYITMDGKEVYRFATKVMVQATKEALDLAGIIMADLDLVIPHQANIRIIEAAARGLHLPMEKFMVNLDRYGNTSTASIPMAAVEAAEQGKLKRGDRIVMVGFGAGLTWGAAAMTWTGPLPAVRKPNLRREKSFARFRSFVRRAVRRVEGLLNPKELD